MPVINFSLRDLKSLLGRDIDYETVVERLPMMGADLHSASRETDEMSFEFFPDRPDLYSVEGMARALLAFLDIKPGLREYDVGKSDIVLTVDPSVNRVRPFIWSALVTDVEMTDVLIRSVMDLQEKLHLTVGRNRKKVAIGIHDFDAVKPPFLYTAVGPTEASFFPLQGTREMNLKEILEQHEKGKAYAFTLEGKSEYPIIYDSEQVVLSFPPIINGIATAVSEETKNIFVDCTGTDLNALRASVNILVTSLAERGAKISSVEIRRDEESMLAPDLRPWDLDVSISKIEELIGIRKPPEELCAYLARMGFGAIPEDGFIRVRIPSYRYDILHPADIIEDLAKAYGYEKFGLKMPAADLTLGISDSELEFWKVLRRAMIGLGYIEITTLTLTCRDDQFHRMRREDSDDVVEVKNPRSEERTILRMAILPEIMAILRKNKHRDLPQRIFEVGEVVVNLRNSGRIAGAVMHSKASFTEMKSTVEAIFRSLGLAMSISSEEDPSFIRGRCASILLGDRKIGSFGEISPEVISSFELSYPVAAFEMDIVPLMQNASTSWSD